MANLVYLDTNILIYLLERHGKLSEDAAEKLESFTRRGCTLITSVITISEFVAGTSADNADILKRVPRLMFVDVDTDIAVRSGELIRQYKCTIGDAIHLSTAVDLRAKHFFTNDNDLSKIASKDFIVATL